MTDSYTNEGHPTVRRLPVLAATLIAPVALLTACGSDEGSTSAESTSAVPITSSATADTPSPAPESSTTATNESAPAADDATGDDTAVEETASITLSPLGSDACAFATPDALMAALRSTPEFDRVARPTGFRRIQCSAPFALASTSGTPQSSGVLFTRAGDGWTVLDVGSAMQCAQYGVTAAQAAALEGCVV
ncbi:hypothetical protein [Williamsia sp. M5A3_1d]